MDERVIRIPDNFEQKYAKEMQVVREEFKDELALLTPEMEKKVVMVMADILHDSPVEHYADIPFGFGAPASYNMCTHVKQVVELSMETVRGLVKYGSLELGKDIDQDIVVASALLHDGSKIMERTKEHTATEMGHTLIHSQLAGVRCWDFGLPWKVCYIASYHTFTPPHVHINPQCIEYVIVTHADIAAADPIFFAQGKPTHFSISKRFFEVQ